MGLRTSFEQNKTNEFPCLRMISSCLNHKFHGAIVYFWDVGEGVIMSVGNSELPTPFIRTRFNTFSDTVPFIGTLTLESK